MQRSRKTRTADTVKPLTKVGRNRSQVSELLLALACGYCALAASPDSNRRPADAWDQDASYLSRLPAPLWGPDPFRRRPGYAPVTESEPNYVLSAVLHDGSDSQAIVNDQVVRIGDEVGWRTVEEIGPNYVLLSDSKDSLIELNLPVAREPFSSIELKEVHREVKETR
jgi:hypothetical protein